MNDSPFQLITYRDTQTSPVRTGLVSENRVVPLETLSAHHPAAQHLAELSSASPLAPAIQGLLADWERNLDVLFELAALVVREGLAHAAESRALEEIRVLAPILRPAKMLYAASNYEEHIREASNWKASGVTAFEGIDKSVTRPYSFIKLSSCIIGPYDPILYPAGFQQLDYEIELALVISKRGKHIPAEQAMTHVAGFMVANDVSLRDLTVRKDWPFLRSDWFAGKNFDTAAPLGPYFVPRHFVPNHLDLHMTLSVNGITRQDSSTRYMIFTPEEQIAFLSSFITLEPGDIIATGTPSGVGFRTGEYLKVGDVIEAEIAGLGRQRNTVIASPQDA